MSPWTTGSARRPSSDPRAASGSSGRRARRPHGLCRHLSVRPSPSSSPGKAPVGLLDARDPKGPRTRDPIARVPGSAPCSGAVVDGHAAVLVGDDLGTTSRAEATGQVAVPDRRARTAGPRRLRVDVDHTGGRRSPRRRRRSSPAGRRSRTTGRTPLPVQVSHRPTVDRRRPGVAGAGGRARARALPWSARPHARYRSRANNGSTPLMWPVSS